MILQHNERPALTLLAKNSIMNYYKTVNQKYKIETTEGLMAYIHDMLAAG